MACENAAPRDYRACRTGGQARHGYPRRVAGVGDAVGPYRIEALLGEGGMGQVFRAAHAQTGDVVALKLLRPSSRATRGSSGAAARGARGAHGRAPPPRRPARRGEADGQHYLALELVPGVTVAERIDAEGRSRSTTSCASPPTWRGARRAARRRDRAPRRQALERPARRRRRARLTDFGLAKGQDYSALTLPGQMLGTIDYLAPELIRGDEPTPLGHLRLRLPGLRVRRGAPAVRRAGPAADRRRPPRRGAARPVRARSDAPEGFARGRRLRAAQGAGRPPVDGHGLCSTNCSGRARGFRLVSPACPS